MAEIVHHAQPFSGGGGRIIASPFQFTTTGEDNLRIISANSLTGVRIGIHGRRFDEKGALRPFSFEHVPNSDRSQKTEDFPLGAGALVNLTVFPSSGSPKVGQTYVIIQLIRGFTGAKIVLGTLLAGYIIVAPPLGWPGSPIQSSTDGSGYLRVIEGTNPSAGNAVSELVPTGARWDVKAVDVELATSAVAGTRRVFLSFTNTIRTFARVPSPRTQELSVITHHWFMQGVQLWVIAGIGYGHSSLPQGRYLSSGWNVFVSAEGMDAGDDFATPVLMVEEWIEL